MSHAFTSFAYTTYIYSHLARPALLPSSALLIPDSTATACFSDEEDDGVSEDLDAALRSLQALTTKVASSFSTACNPFC